MKNLEEILIMLSTNISSTSNSVLTQAQAESLLALDFNNYGIKALDGTLVGITKGNKFYSSSKLKKFKKIEHISEYQICVDSKHLELHHANDDIAKTGKNWVGIEPCFWDDQEAYGLIHKHPIYDNKQKDIIGTLYYGAIFQQQDLIQWIKELQQVPAHIGPNINSTKEFYQQDEYLLSPREQECLFYTLRGKRAKEVAQLLLISPKTVEFHLENIKLKFKCFSKSELIAKAIEQGYLEKIPCSIFKQRLQQ